MTEWAENYNTILSFDVRIYIDGVETEYSYETPKEAFDKFVELRTKYQCNLDDHPGGDHGEKWLTWMPNDEKTDPSLPNVELMLMGKYDPEVDQYRYNRSWLPRVHKTIYEAFIAIAPDYKFSIYDSHPEID
tara:strand:+ start:2771 stop:3166 length:396 start_codon:yes stop_codon:yes gene_type:complete